MQGKEVGMKSFFFLEKTRRKVRWTFCCYWPEKNRQQDNQGAVLFVSYKLYIFKEKKSILLLIYILCRYTRK